MHMGYPPTQGQAYTMAWILPDPKAMSVLTQPCPCLTLDGNLPALGHFSSGAHVSISCSLKYMQGGRGG